MSAPQYTFTDQHLPPPPPAPRKSGWKVFVLIGTLLSGGMLLACCGIGGLVYFVNIREIAETVTAEDRELAVTAEDILHHAPDVQVDPTLGKLRKVSHVDRSRELEYEFEAAEGTGPLYIFFNASVQPTNNDAQWAYSGLGIGLGYGFARGGENLQQEERNDLWSYGEQSRCVILTNKHGKVGNLFVARKGRRVFMLLIVGVYFEDSGAISELLTPMLERLEQYEGK